MTEIFTEARAPIADLAGEVEEARFRTFAATVGRPADFETRAIFEKCVREEHKDPNHELDLLKDEVRVIPLVDLLRDTRQGKVRKFS